MNPSFSLSSISGAWPDLIVLLGAFAVLLVDIPLRAQKGKAVVAGLTALVLVGALGVLASQWNAAPSEPFPGMLKADPLARTAKLALLLIGLGTLAIGRRISPQAGLVQAEYYALLLFAVAGMMFFAGASNLMAAFVALETFSLAMYVLAGFNRRNKDNREAALKYFLIGAFAAGFFLFGLAVLYGSTGSVSFDGIHAAWEAASAALAAKAPAAEQGAHAAAALTPQLKLILGGAALVMVGLGFKVGLAPFHLWAPDTYEGAPTPVTAFLSAGAKIAGFAALARFGLSLPMSHPALIGVVSVLAVLTMTLANLGALRQEGLKRLMAYSSVAHSGYALVALAGGAASGPSAVMNYVFTYAVMNYAAFALIIALEQDHVAVAHGGRQVTLADLQGLGFERPLYGFCLAAVMFAMAGIPPTAGFIAKLNVFRAALDAGQVTLVVLAALNSVLSAAYYLRVLVALYMKPKLVGAQQPAYSGLVLLSTLVCVAAVLFWGILPQSLLKLSSF